MSDQTSLITALTGLFRSGAQSSLQTAELQLYRQYLEPELGAAPSVNDDRMSMFSVQRTNMLSQDFVSYYDSFPGNDPVHLTSLLL